MNKITEYSRHLALKKSNTKYPKRHQSNKEKQRRLNQIANGMLKVA